MNMERLDKKRLWPIAPLFTLITKGGEHLRQEPVVGFCELNNEPSVSTE